MAADLVVPLEKFLNMDDLRVIPEPLRERLMSGVQSLYNMFLGKTTDLQTGTQVFQQLYDETKTRLHEALEDRSKLQDSLVSLREDHLKVCQSVMKLEDRSVADQQRLEELELQLSSAEDCKAELAEMVSQSSAEITALEERLRREGEVRMALAKEKSALELRLIDSSTDRVPAQDAEECWSVQKEMLSKERERLQSQLESELKSVRSLKEELQGRIAHCHPHFKDVAERHENVQSDRDKLSSSMDLLESRIADLISGTNQVNAALPKVSDTETGQIRDAGDIGGKVEIGSGKRYIVGDQYEGANDVWQVMLAEKTMRIRELEELLLELQSKNGEYTEEINSRSVEMEEIVAENLKLQQEVAEAHKLISNLLTSTISWETVDDSRKAVNTWDGSSSTIDQSRSLDEEMVNERDDDAERRQAFAYSIEAVLREVMRENSLSRNVVDLRSQNEKLLSILHFMISSREHVIRENVRRNVVEANRRLEQLSALTEGLCRDNAEAQSHLAKVIVERNWYKEETERLTKLLSDHCCPSSSDGGNSTERLLEKNAKLHAVSVAYDHQLKNQNETVENLSRMVVTLKKRICSLETDRRHDASLICEQKEQLEREKGEAERLAQCLAELSEQNRALKEQLSSAVGRAGAAVRSKDECLAEAQLGILTELLRELKTTVFPVSRHAERDDSLAMENGILLSMLSGVCRQSKMLLTHQRSNVFELALQLDEKADQIEELAKERLDSESGPADASETAKSKGKERIDPLGHGSSMALFGNGVTERSDAVHSEMCIAGRQYEQNASRLSELNTRLQATESDLEECKFLARSFEEGLIRSQESAVVELNQQNVHCATLKRRAETCEQRVIELTDAVNSESANHFQTTSSYEERMKEVKGELYLLKKENAAFISQSCEQTESLTFLESVITSLRQTLVETANSLAALQVEGSEKRDERGNAQEKFTYQQDEVAMLKRKLAAAEDGQHDEVETMNREINRYRSCLAALEKVIGGKVTRLIGTFDEKLLHNEHCSTTCPFTDLDDGKKLALNVCQVDFDSGNGPSGEIFAQLVERLANVRRLAFSRVLVAETQVLSYRLRNELVEMENRRLRSFPQATVPRSGDVPLETDIRKSGEKSLPEMLELLRTNLEMRWDALFVDRGKETGSCCNDGVRPQSMELLPTETEEQADAAQDHSKLKGSEWSGSIGSPSEIVSLPSSSVVPGAVSALDENGVQSRLRHMPNRQETSSEGTTVTRKSVAVHLAQSSLGSSFRGIASPRAQGASRSDGAGTALTGGDGVAALPSSSSSPPPVDSSQGIISANWEVDNEGISSSLIVEIGAPSGEIGSSSSLSSDLHRHPKRDAPLGEPAEGTKRRRVISPVLVSTTGEDEESAHPFLSFAMEGTGHVERENGAASPSVSTIRCVTPDEEDVGMAEQPESSGQGIEAGDVVEELQIEETSEALFASGRELTSTSPCDNPGSPEEDQHS